MAAPSIDDARTHLASLIEQARHAVAPGVTDAAVVLERPRHSGHGDYACNLALQLAKPLRAKPHDIAVRLVAALQPSPVLEKAEVAGAGFINLFLRLDYKQQVVRRILAGGHAYGRLALGRKKRVQVEFVSANPTGPLHIGHGRGAAYGASLANVLAAAGFEVTREYYVNDAGRQMDILALSTWLRYLEQCGRTVAFPANAYKGDYVRDMGRRLRDKNQDRFNRDAPAVADPGWPAGADEEGRLDALINVAKSALGADYAAIHELVLNEQLADCRDDLTEFGVIFDNWFSEQSLYESGLVERSVTVLEEKGHAYAKDGALWFRSSAFGDEKDRVLRRENGQYTYFASDIAYHQNKFERGFDLVIDVWGADHHGYIPRVRGALEALGLNPAQLTVALVQFAVLYRNGQKVSMSTRAGDFVTLRELRQEVGNDAAHFFYLLRKCDQHLDFDLDLAKSKSNENPVYYVQYAHARVCSLLEQWDGDAASLAAADPAALISDAELGLLARLMEYPETVESAAADLAPHVITFYLRELAAQFHSYYNATRILVEEAHVKHARLALACAVRQVIANGLALLGVSAPDKM